MVTELVVSLAYGTLRERGSKLRAASVCDTLCERREVRATPTLFLRRFPMIDILVASHFKYCSVKRRDESPSLQ
ncbi:MAG: hypothetical protein V7K77_14965 [Nostoc sp.]|uniref:hypothetical protein n=1 Tax=Nostoc sp. TaxID=1180 RepID=UPI002FFA0E27